MAFLGLDFIISSTILMIVSSIILYVYRKRVFKFYYKDTPSNLFLQNIQDYLIKNHSKIKFNFRELSKTQSSSSIIIDNVISQFIDAPLKTDNLNLSIQQSQLWDSYTFNARPNGEKLPDDWAKRKSITLQRDKNICQRCGVKTKPENAQLHIIKPIKDGGQYYLENLIILCRDCEKIMTKSDIKYLDIRDELNSFIDK